MDFDFLTNQGLKYFAIFCSHFDLLVTDPQAVGTPIADGRFLAEHADPDFFLGVSIGLGAQLQLLGPPARSIMPEQ
jgi:hypothetical protein